MLYIMNNNNINNNNINNITNITNIEEMNNIKNQEISIINKLNIFLISKQIIQSNPPPGTSSNLAALPPHW